MITQEIVRNLCYALSLSGRANISLDQNYRYTLHRTWNEPPNRSCNFIMCNPSTADAYKLDPTVRKCLIWAVKWGYDELVVTNIFAYRSTEVKQIYKVEDPVGIENNHHIIETFNQCKNDGLIICAWGLNGKHLNRHHTVLKIALANNIPLHYLKLSKDGYPYHPLYLPNSTTPTKWDYANQVTT